MKPLPLFARKLHAKGMMYFVNGNVEFCFFDGAATMIQRGDIEFVFSQCKSVCDFKFNDVIALRI